MQILTRGAWGDVSACDGSVRGCRYSVFVCLFVCVCVCVRAYVCEYACSTSLRLWVCTTVRVSLIVPLHTAPKHVFVDGCSFLYACECMCACVYMFMRRNNHIYCMSVSLWMWISQRYLCFVGSWVPEGKHKTQSPLEIQMLLLLFSNLGLALPGSPTFGWEVCVCMCFKLLRYVGKCTQTSGDEIHIIHLS